MRVAALALALALGGSPALAGSVEILVTLPDGRPARDIRVSLEERRGGARLYRGALTDPQGRARIENLSPGTYHLSFGPWPYRDLVRPDENPYAPLEPVTLARPEDELTLEVRLMAGVPVAVSVDPSDGERNHFSAAFRNLETGLVLQQGFDRAGDLERVLARGRWQVSVQTTGGYLLESVTRDRQPVAVRSTSPPLGPSVWLDLETEPFATHLVWRYLAEARLTGEVIFEGERAGVRIAATLLEPGPALLDQQSRGRETPRRPTAGLDRHDRFEMALPAGRWRIRPVSEWPLTGEPEQIDIELAAGEVAMVRFTVRVEKGDLLGVRVVDEDREPVRGAVVEVRPLAPEGMDAAAEAPLLRSTETDRWGRARIAGLPPRTGVRVVAGHPDLLVGEAVLEDFDPRNPEKSGTSIELPHGARLVAVAMDRAGEPVANVEVTVERIDALPPLPTRSEEVRRSKEHRLLKTGGNGRADAKGFYPGRHRVTAKAGGLRGTARRARVARPGERPADEVEVSLDLATPTEVEVWIEPAARFVASLYCSDGWNLPPAADVRVAPMTETGPDEDAAVLRLDGLDLAGEDRDRLEAGPLTAGLFALAVRPLGFRRWTWIYESHDPAGAYPLPVDRDEVAGGETRDLGAVAIECGPAVDLLPEVRSGDPLPPLHEIRVEARIFDRETGVPLAEAPLATPRTDRIELRGLPVGAVRLRVALRHPHFLPTDTVTWEGEGELERGAWLEARPAVPALGGSLRVAAPGSPAALLQVRLPAPEGEPGVETEGEIRRQPLEAGRAVVPSLPPGPVDVELCIDETCDPPLRRWDDVEIVLGKETRLDL